MMLEFPASKNAPLYKGQNKVVTVNSVAAKPISAVYPKSGQVLTTAEVKNPLKFIIGGPDKTLDYFIIVYDNAPPYTGPEIVRQEGANETVNIPANSLIPGHTYTIWVKVWNDMGEHLSDKPELAFYKSTFSVAKQ